MAFFLRVLFDHNEKYVFDIKFFIENVKIILLEKEK